MIRPVFVAFAFSFLQPALIAADPAKFVRIAPVDISASMDGDHLKVVREELAKLVVQLPPSPEYPFILVPFDDRAHSPIVCTELDKCQAAIAGLRAQGGTNIASGLEAAHQVIMSVAGKANVVVLLYTDGADANQEAIRLQEERLNTLFSQRHKAGLQQTVVFCKRWGNANATLAQSMKARGYINVVDAAELKLVSLTLQPQVTIVASRWDANDPLKLEVDYIPSVDVTGNLGSERLPPARFKCTNDRADGAVQTTAVPGNDSGQAQTLRIALSLKDLQQQKTTLSFSVDRLPSVTFSDAVLLPIMPNTKLTVPVDLPQTRLRSVVIIATQQVAPGEWEDPTKLVARYSVELTLTAKPTHAVPIDGDTTFEITAVNGTALVDGPTKISLDSQGSETIELSVLTSVPNPQNSSFYQIGLTLRAIKTPAHVYFDPPSHTIIMDKLPIPSQLRTNLSATQLGDSQVQWIDFMHGLALVESSIKVRVDGPIPPGTKLAFSPPACVAKLQSVPATLRSGEQMARLRFISALESASHESTLSFAIQSPNDTPSISFSVTEPVKLSVAIPAPARLVLLNRAGAIQTLEQHISDVGADVHIPVQPSILFNRRRLPSGAAPAARFRASGLQIRDEKQFRLNALDNLTFRLEPPTKRSFFFDSFVTGSVDVLPVAASPAIAGSRYPVRIVVDAPFKRIAFYLAVSLSCLAASFLVFRMYSRLTQPV